jgi:hypothetical protein
MKICGNDIIVKGSLVRTARIDGEKYQFPDDPEAMLDGLRKSGLGVDIFTFLQKVPDTKPKYPYPMEWDNLAVLPVTTFDHWWNNQIRSYPRNRARQAEKKGVVLREIPLNDDLLKGICAIYNETPVRQGRQFPHYGMTFERARSYAATFVDRSIWIGAFLDGEMIGFVKLVTDEDRTMACLVHILSMAAQKDKAPTNALIAHSVKACAERGISNLIYENFTYGKKQGDSLSHFKEVNGFQRVDVPRYYIPLTPMGWATYRLGFHHRLVDRIPESIAGKLRAWRKTFYERKSPLEETKA